MKNAEVEGAKGKRANEEEGKGKEERRGLCSVHTHMRTHTPSLFREMVRERGGGGGRERGGRGERGGEGEGEDRKTGTQPGCRGVPISVAEEEKARMLLELETSVATS